MRKKQIIDVTGTPLTPSPQGENCLGNGKHEDYPCCCDECNYFLYCFPQFNWSPKMQENEEEYSYESVICEAYHASFLRDFH